MLLTVTKGSFPGLFSVFFVMPDRSQAHVQLLRHVRHRGFCNKPCPQKTMSTVL